MFEYVSTYKNLFIRREERKKAIVEYLLKRINERSLFVHRQTRRWIGLFASSCKVGTILLTVPRPCHKVTLYRVFLVTRASAYFVICQSRVSARGNAKLSWQDSTEWNRLEDDPFNLAFVRQQTNSKLIKLFFLLTTTVHFLFRKWSKSIRTFSGRDGQEGVRNKERRVRDSFSHPRRARKQISIALELPPVRLYGCCNTRWRSR